MASRSSRRDGVDEMVLVEITEAEGTRDVGDGGGEAWGEQETFQVELRHSNTMTEEGKSEIFTWRRISTLLVSAVMTA